MERKWGKNRSSLDGVRSILQVNEGREHSSVHPLWAACQEIRGSGVERGAQKVCIALDDRQIPLDNRIFDWDYANDVALEIFDWF